MNTKPKKRFHACAFVDIDTDIECWSRGGGITFEGDDGEGGWAEDGYSMNEEDAEHLATHLNNDSRTCCWSNYDEINVEILDAVIRSFLKDLSEDDFVTICSCGSWPSRFTGPANVAHSEDCSLMLEGENQ